MIINQENNGKILLEPLPVISNFPTLSALTPIFGESNQPTLLFQNIPPSDWKDSLPVIKAGEKPNALLFPHDWRFSKRDPAYLEKCIDIAKERKLPIIGVAYGDSDAQIDFPAVFFRTSIFKSSQSPMDISMPAVVEDVGKNGVSIRDFPKEKISVGFVGRASINGVVDSFRYLSKTLFRKNPRKDGRFYRRVLIDAVSNSKDIDAKIVWRKSYSGNIRSIELDPNQARREYLENLINTDFSLAPRGDGNYSLRFFESLSMGRIPIVPDTEVVLPLSGIIDYSEFSILLKLSEVNSVGEVLKKWITDKGEGGWLDSQRKAREVFSEMLYIPKFFKQACSEDIIGGALSVSRSKLGI